MESQPMICLAKSRKKGAWCVAGRHFDQGQIGHWIRPVTDPGGGAVQSSEMCSGDGSPVEVLDIVRVPLVAPVPSGYQLENYLLDRSRAWEREGRAHWTTVYQSQGLYDEGFWKDYGSTSHGIRDQIPGDAVETLGGSLALIFVRQFQLLVDWGHDHTKVRAQFMYEGEQYRLMVTDPKIDQPLIEISEERHASACYDRGMAMLCISVGELFHGTAYRLVASVITPHQCEERR